MRSNQAAVHESRENGQEERNRSGFPLNLPSPILFKVIAIDHSEFSQSFWLIWTFVFGVGISRLDPVRSPQDFPLVVRSYSTNIRHDSAKVSDRRSKEYFETAPLLISRAAFAPLLISRAAFAPLLPNLSRVASLLSYIFFVEYLRSYSVWFQ